MKLVLRVFWVPAAQTESDEDAGSVETFSFIVFPINANVHFYRLVFKKKLRREKRMRF